MHVPSFYYFIGHVNRMSTEHKWRLNLRLRKGNDFAKLMKIFRKKSRFDCSKDGHTKSTRRYCADMTGRGFGWRLRRSPTTTANKMATWRDTSGLVFTAIGWKTTIGQVQISWANHFFLVSLAFRNDFHSPKFHGRICLMRMAWVFFRNQPRSFFVWIHNFNLIVYPDTSKCSTSYSQSSLVLRKNFWRFFSLIFAE